MAYLPENEADRQRRMQQEGQQGPQVASGASGVITGAQAQPTGMGASAAKGPAKSGAFTNLNSYIQANKPQAASLARNVADNVAKQADKAKESVTGLQGQFQQQAQAGGVARNQNLVNEAVTNPNAVLQDQAKAAQFKQMRDAEYKGPSSLQDVQGYTDTRNAYTNANQALENTKSEAGRFSLVQQQFAKPSYSRGQQRLDQLLLQNSPEARQSFADVQGRYTGLMDQLTGAEKSAGELAAARKAETEAARTDVQTALGQFDDPNTSVNEAAGAFGNMQTDLQKRTADYKQQQQSLYDRAQAQIKEGKGFDADVMDLLGLKEGDNLYNVDLGALNPTFNPDAINEQSVATSEDYGRYKALSELAGIDPTYLYDESQAGKAARVQYDHDTLAAQRENAQRQLADVRGRSRDMANMAGMYKDYFGGNAVTALDPNTATPDDLRKFLSEIGDRDSLEAMRRAADSAGSLNTGGGGSGDAARITTERSGIYDQINNWLKSYDALNPNRTVTRK
ncbi:hypothetical protein UFOVP1351_23 [uncultured Caudovirales phage]|uniref:Uncharacterized protein n=1 Tax=uncultured Caudovirales phage TaxID=2100421 RepID=A0A6J5S371_9CAUD|nr:hypothetical protein UFOVP1351_23 [uncultured Caudovirales phage]